MSGSVALNPKLLEKQSVPTLEEVKLEIPIKELALIDTENMRVSLSKLQQIVTETISTLRDYYPSDLSVGRKQIEEMQGYSTRLTEQIGLIEQKFDDFQQVIALLTENLPLEKQVLLELNRVLSKTE